MLQKHATALDKPAPTQEEGASSACQFRTLNRFNPKQATKLWQRMMIHTHASVKLQRSGTLNNHVADFISQIRVVNLQGTSQSAQQSMQRMLLKITTTIGSTKLLIGYLKADCFSNAREDDESMKLWSLNRLPLPDRKMFTQIHDSVEKKQARSGKVCEPLITKDELRWEQTGTALRRPLESVRNKSSVRDMLIVDITVFMAELPYIIERSPR